MKRSLIEVSARGSISYQEVQRYLEILFRDVVLRSFIEVSPTDLATDLVQVLLIGALT